MVLIESMEAPRERPELWHLGLEIGGIGLYEIDFERDCVHFSDELCEMFGLPVGSLMTSREALRLVDGRDRVAVAARAKAARNPVAKGEWRGVYRVVRSDGAVLWASIHGREVYRDSPLGPQPLRSIGALVDVTHLKATEDASRESERRLRFALDAAKMGTFEADIAGMQAHVDVQGARLLGLPENTRVVAIGELRKRIPLDDLEPSDAKKKRLTDGLEPYRHEFRINMPDGSERWLSAHADVRDNRIFGVHFDVTEQKRIELALRESETRLRLAVDGSALGVFEWGGKEDHAVWENDRMYEILGRAKEEGPLSRRQFVDHYLHPDDVGAFEAALEETIRTGATFQAVCRTKWKKGSHRWLQIEAKPVPGLAGDEPRLVGVVADITLRKRLERRAVLLSRRMAAIQGRERRRIAQELHDSTVQHLVAATMLLMKLRPANVSPEKGKAWNDIEGCLDEAIKELRNFSYFLHPPALRGNQLHDTLRDYIFGFARRSEIKVRARLSPEVDQLSPACQRAIFRIVQEGLANIYRHATASRAIVDLRILSSGVHLVIKDNGRGLRRGAALRPGVGLRGMRARLHEVGGKIRLTATKTGGAVLHAVILPQRTRGAG